MKNSRLMNKVGNVFSRFDDLNLTTKLSGLLAGLVLGYIAIGYAYYQVLDTEKELLALDEKILAFESGVKDIEIDLESAKQNESLFYAKKYPIYLSKFDTHIITASQNVNGLIKLIEGEKDLENITVKLGEYFEEYRSKFIVAAESMLSIGLDETQGYLGDARASVHKIEQLVKKVDSDKLLISMLQIRRHEKDYLSRVEKKYIDRANLEISNFKKILNRTKTERSTKVAILNTTNDYQKDLNNIFKEMSDFQYSVKLIGSSIKKIKPLFSQLTEISDQIVTKQRAAANLKNQAITAFFLTTLITSLVLISIALYFISRSIIKAMKRLQSTVVKVNDGDMEARAELNRNDELGHLGQAFDKLLDERLQTLAESEKQTEILNESVINLIRSVSSLAQNKDLAVKIPVSEDITGAIGDSLNLLSNEISNTLQEVKETSTQVASVSNDVKAQSDHVIDVANLERKEVEETTGLLSEAVTSMNLIATSAQKANDKANSTIENTQQALETVMLSVDGINSIRSTIGETEKRIKRLGERSQEITGIVNLINSIAERTHILALNASMHAASAGEAGRGFAVVADEVQRLAENAREATSEISTLVNNIRVETSDTVTTMNTAISQVAEGTRLAEQASLSMRKTQEATTDLVNSVKEIADRSVDQATASNKVLEKTKQIQSSTEQTGKELLEQTKNTDRLVQYSAELVSSVGVFKLPGDAEVSSEDTIISHVEPEELKEAI